MRKVLPGKEISEKLSDELKARYSKLEKGEVLAGYIRNVETDDSKVQIEFAEYIPTTDTPQNALAMFNADDDRFNVRGARRVWLTASREIAVKMMGSDVPEDAAFVEINKIMEPEKNAKGVPVKDFRIRIVEKLESQMTDAEKEYPDNYLKRIPSSESYFYNPESGERVASTTQLVIVERNADGSMGDPKHVFIKGEYKSQNIGNALGAESANDSLKSMASNFAG